MIRDIQNRFIRLWHRRICDVDPIDYHWVRKIPAGEVYTVCDRCYKGVQAKANTYEWDERRGRFIRLVDRKVLGAPE